MNTRPSILLYGTCQTHNIHRILGTLPSITAQFAICSIQNFAHPLTGALEQPDPEALENCRCLLYQDSGDPLPPWVQELRTRVESTLFPLALCQPLWPQYVARLQEDVSDADFPFGRFPDGDAILRDLVLQRKDDETVVREYFATDFSEVYPLDGLITHWTQQVEKLDAVADVPIGVFIRNNWRDQRLFWTLRHPSNTLLGYVLKEFLARTFPGLVPQAELHQALQQNELNHWITPVHPSVARHFGIRWFSADSPVQHWGFGSLTYDAWARLYVRHLRQWLLSE